MATVNVISRDDYKKTTANEQIKSENKTVNVMTRNDYKGISPAKSTKQQVEDEAKEKYDSATKLYQNLLNQRKNIVKEEYNKMGANAPKMQLQFSTNPSPTFVRNADGTTTIKSQYEKNQEAIKENQAKQRQLNNALKNNTTYQALGAMATPLNNQRLLAKYNYNIAKEDNRDLTFLDKTLGVPYRAALDFMNLDMLDTNNYYIDENNNKMILPSEYQIRQEKVRNSYGDDIFGKVARFGTDLGYNLTKIGISSAINALTAPTGVPLGSVMYFEDMGLDSFNQAKLDGYDDGSAALYGVINVASEMVTEKFLGGISKNLKLTKGDSQLASGINKALSKVMKNDRLRSALSNALSEGAEEFVQEFIENYNKKLVLEKKSLGKATEETLLNSDVWSDALYSTLLGMGSGGLLGAAGDPSIDTNNTGVIPDIDKQGNIDIKTYISQLDNAKNNTTNQSKIDNINQTLSYLELNEALGNDKVNAQTMNQEIKNLEPALEKISNILPNDTNIDNKIDNKIDTKVETKINNNINTNNNIENGLYDDTQVYRNFGKALENDTLPGNGNEVVLPKASDNANTTTQNSIQETQTTQNVGTEQRLQVAPTSNVKVNNLYDSASKYFNNSEQSLNLMNTLSKVVKDKGYNIVFDDTNMNTKNGIINGKIETKNGETTITLNPYSPRAYEFVLVHEITHAIETNSLKSMIMDYAQKNSEFNAALDSLKKIYKTNEITSEVAADISGQLLGNQEFINQLSMNKPGLFQHLYNEIKALYHKLRGWKSENEFIEDLMNKWEYAYATQQNNLKKQSYSKQEIRNNPKNEATFEGEPFWSGSVNLLDGVIEEVHPYEDAADVDFHHSEYFSEPQIEKMENGENAFFWVQDGKIEGTWRDNVPQDIIDKIKKQIKIKSNTTISTNDSNGKTLTKAQQEYFKDSKVRDADGNLLEVYHGTNKDFTVFDKSKIGTNTYNDGLFGRGFYFTNKENVADSYSKYHEGNPNVKKGYLNLENPFDWNSIKTEEQMQQFIKDNNIPEGVLTWNRYQQEIHTITDINNEAAFTDALKEAGYDGVIYTYRQQDENNAPVKEIVAFESNQFKNVDNTSPTINEDIRYSKQNQNWQDYVENNFKNEGTTTKYSISEKTGKLQDSNGKDVKLETSNVGDTGSLMAIHNLSAEKLQGILELGGFPVPSIAVTNPDLVNHNQFGEISVLFDKSTIDPEIKANEVYDRDVWSSTFSDNVKIDYNIESEKLWGLEKNMYHDYKDDIASTGLNRFFDADNLDSKIKTRGIEGTIEDAKQSPELMYIYEKTVNPDYQPVIKSKQFNNKYSNELLQNFIDNYKGTTPLNELRIDENVKEQFKKAVKPYYDSEMQQFLAKLKPEQRESGKKLMQETYDNDIEKSQNINEFLISAYRLQQEGLDAQTIDKYATLNKIKDDVNQAKFEKWVDDGLGNMLRNAEKGIYNGKDYITNTGRRTFKQLHNPYSLENIVKALKKGDTKGSQQTIANGFGKIQAQMGNKFESISDIKNAENQITTSENAHNKIASLEEVINQDIYDLADRLDGGYFNMDNASNLIQEYASKKTRNEAVFRKLANDYANIGIPSELINRITNHLEQLKTIPTDYFEAKPQRAVGLDEIQQIVLPNNTDIALKQELQKRGINYTEYDPNIEGDRQRVVNQFDNLKFSKNNKTWQQYLEENYVSRGTRTFGKDVLADDVKQARKQKGNTIDHYVINQVAESIPDTSVAKGNDILRAENNIDNSNLTKAEINELNNLNAIREFASDQETARLEYLENKRDGLIKYPELKQKVEFKDISREYTKFKNNIGEFDPTLLNEAESNVKGYRNTKTKAQWLDIAEQIGANFKGNGQELTNYALQSWFEAQPNQKKSLNREGKGYVKFNVDEWVNAVYKGAGVGEKVTRTSAAPAIKTTKVENDYNTYTQAEINNMFQFSDDDGHKIALPDNVGERLATKTTLTPIEVGNLQNIIDSAYQINVNGNNLEIVGDYDNTIYTVKATKQGDTYVIDDMVKGSKNGLGSLTNNNIETSETTNNNFEEKTTDNVAKFESRENDTSDGYEIVRPKITKPENQYKETVKNATDMKESSFYKNATETSKFLTEDNRAKLSEIGDLKYYESVSNEEALNKASKRLSEKGTTEAYRWLQQDNKTSDASDVAEGWILLKNYQDAGDFESMVAVAKKLRQMGTTAGQAVQAYNIMARLTPEGMVKYAQSELSEAYDIYAKNKSKQWVEQNASKFDLNAQEVGFIVDTMKQVQQMEDGRAKNVKLGEVQKMLTDKLPPEKGSGIKAWMRISMLFNPKTQIRNVMGNAVITPVNMIGDYFAAAADKIIAKKTGVRTTGKTDIKSYAKGFKQGLYESYDDFKRGINTRNIDGNRFELGQAKSFNDNNAIGKALNKVDSINSFLLDAGDRGFYEASFTNSINNQLALNNTTKVTQDMIDIATSEALSRTWQDNNNYTKFVLTTRNMLNKVNVKGYGLGDILIPFAKTPANLTKAIVDYSPAGMVNAIIQAKNLKNNISTGLNTAQQQHQFVQTLGKATAGTILYVAAYGLAKAGIATGKSDDDKDTRDFLKNTLGVSSYSIKIGNKSFTYDWAQPVAAPLSIMTNVVNAKNNKGQALLESITSSLDSAGSILLEQSFLKSINEVLTDNDGIVSGIENAILDLPARAIPTFSKQIVDMTDGTQRQTFEYDQPLKTAVNKLKAKIPGLSKTLEPSVDSLGRDIQKYGGKNNIFNVFLNPANVNTSNISEAAEEIYKVYKETGDNTIMPRVAPYYINSKGQKTILNTEQRKDYQRVAGNIIENGVNELKKNSNYKAMSYEDKSAAIKNIVDYAYNKARKDVLGMEMPNTYNKVNEWLDKGGSVANYYADKEEVNYSLQNPTKYNAIKSMNIDYDDYKTYQAKVNEIKNKYSGTKNANIRKQKVAEYINSLSLSANKKIMLFKMLGNYSIKNYSNDIYKYINNFDLTAKEKQEIYNSLF